MRKKIKTQKQKQKSPDRLVKSKDIELTEKDLEKVSGGSLFMDAVAGKLDTTIK